MRAEHGRFWVFGLELCHELGPEQTGGTELGDLHEEVLANIKEEAQPSSEFVDIEAFGQRRSHVFDAIGECVRQLNIKRRPRFLDVITRDRDRVKSWHVVCRVLDDVGDDPHRWFRWVDVGVTYHELFKNVVLDRACQLILGDALFFARHDVAGQDR